MFLICKCFLLYHDFIFFTFSITFCSLLQSCFFPFHLFPFFEILFAFSPGILFDNKTRTPIILLYRTYTSYLHTVLTHYKVYVLTIIAGKSEANKSGKSVRGEDVFVWSTPVINSLCRNISTHRLLPGRCHR